MSKQEVEIQRKPDTVDKGLNLWQKWNVLTMTVGVGAVGVGAFFGIPLLVGAGAASVAVDGAQMYGVNKIKGWKEKRKQEQAMREQLSVNVKSEVSIVQKIKEAFLPKSATIYRKPQSQPA